MWVWCSPAAVRASFKKRRRADESGAAWTPEHLEGDRAVEPDVHRLVNCSHSSAAELAHNPVTRDPPAGLDPVIEPPRRPGPRAGRRAHANQAVNQLEALEGRSNVFFNAGIPCHELIKSGGLALLGREEIQFDGFADAIVIVARFGEGFKIRWGSPSLNLRVPPGGPSIERFRFFSPRAMIPRIDFRLTPNRSPIASNERLSAA